MTPLWVLLARLLAVAAVLWLLAGKWRIAPSTRLAYAAIAPVVASFGLFIDDAFIWLVLGLDALLVAVALADLFTLPGAGAFLAERHLARIASLRKDHPISLVVSNRSRRAAEIWVCDDADEELRPDPPEFHLTLAAQSRATMAYRLRPGRRGAFTFRQIYLRVASRLSLWRRDLRYPALHSVFVYPDLKQMSEYALLARTNRLSLMGLRRARRIGQDNEFERLRDYTPDDHYRHIEWRATARRHKLTVKDFQANQSQRVVFLLDCGRMMTNESGGLSMLDHAMNAMLMLAYVALERGDSVGLVCFSSEIHAYVPPQSGRRQMNRLLHAVFDRFPQMVESRYDEAFVYLGSHCRKRALVVLITNLIDEVNSRQIEQHLAALAGRHLPLGVLLRDPRLFEPLAVEPAEFDRDPASLFRAAAAADIVSWRAQVLADLNAKGVLSLDVFPDSLTAPLVNRYLEIKARHLL